MSLDFHLEPIENYESTCYDDTGMMRPVTHSLIYATIVVGLGEITEKNAEEFYARLNCWERLNGTYMRNAEGPIFITPAEVRAHIGLKTNVPNETPTQFVKRTITGIPNRTVGFLGDMRRMYRSEIQSLKRAEAGV